MRHHDPGNLLGAAAIAVLDAIGTLADEAIGHGGETAAALVAIGHRPGLSNDDLRQVLGLSHPGTVRAVDRLAEAGLVQRRPGHDRRTLALHLTPAGWTRRTALLLRRQTALDAILAPLAAAERATLGELLAKILQSLPLNALHGLSICRLCDETSCANCPIDAGIASTRAIDPNAPPRLHP